MPHLPDLWIVWSLAQGEVTPGEGFQDPPWGKRERRAPAPPRWKTAVGRLVASDVRIIHTDTCTICHTCILYTTRARIHTHTHTHCFSYGEVGVNAFLAIHDLHILYALGSPNPRKPRRRSKRRLPHQRLRRLEATQNCLQLYTAFICFS